MKRSFSVRPWAFPGVPAAPNARGLVGRSAAVLLPGAEFLRLTLIALRPVLNRRSGPDERMGPGSTGAVELPLAVAHSVLGGTIAGAGRLCPEAQLPDCSSKRRTGRRFPGFLDAHSRRRPCSKEARGGVGARVANHGPVHNCGGWPCRSRASGAGHACTGGLRSDVMNDGSVCQLLGVYFDHTLGHGASVDEGFVRNRGDRVGHVLIGIGDVSDVVGGC